MSAFEAEKTRLENGTVLNDLGHMSKLSFQTSLA